MRELLYVPSIDPPEQVLHHAILYRDAISTLLPGDPEHYMSDRTKRAYDAGVFRPRLARDVWVDASIRDASTAAVRRNRESAVYRDTGTVANWVAEQMNDPEYRDGLRIKLDFELPPTVWTEVIEDVFGLRGYSMRTLSDHDDDVGVVAPARLSGWETALLIGAAVALAGMSRRDATAPLIVPCYADEVSQFVRDWTGVGGGEHLLARIDVGGFLPEPPPGIDTGVVIEFRQRYDDERRRLIRAVERLVTDAARVHGVDEQADIKRDVREELDDAMEDMKKAGRHVFKGWVRRAAWFTVASGAGAVAGPVGAVAGAVAANWASNPVPRGAQVSDYTYLYRVQNGLDEFSRTAW